MKYLNKYRLLMPSIILCLFAIISCDDDMYNREMYHSVLYLNSSGDYNVYTAVFPFKDTAAIGYLSIGCGGSKTNQNEVTIELEPDTVLLKTYNKMNFVLDSAKYAKLLSTTRFQFSTYKILFPAKSVDPYVNVPIKVNQQGLSPDSIYFIPITIKSVSRYEINPMKKSVLFQVAVENDYAEQVNTTVYYQRGTLTSGTTITPVGGSKILQPLSKNEVRMFAGTQIQTNKSTLNDIKSWSIVAKVNNDNTITLRSYGTIILEQLSQTGYNRFYTQKDVNDKDVMYIDLYYRYKLQSSTTWTEVKESLQRLN